MAKAANPKSDSGSPAREKKTTSFILYSDTKKKVNYISVMDEMDITEIVDTALNEYISKWEKKNGPIPEKK